MNECREKRLEEALLEYVELYGASEKVRTLYYEDFGKHEDDPTNTKDAAWLIGNPPIS